jgi:hypothetical protein
LNKETAQFIYDLFPELAKLNIWQWAEQNIDYSRSPSYDSEWKGPYRLSYMPYLREPLEACSDPVVKEVWMWACTRAGKSENLLLTVMRYLIATNPPHTMLYIGGQQEKVESFYGKRIVRGFNLSQATADRLERASVREHSIDFHGLCDLVVSWAANKQVTKGDSYPVIFADEVSSWPSFKADTLRERQATVAFPKLIGVSSADAESRRSSDEDPIIQEWENTDMREYMMPDPADRTKKFRYVMGGPDVPHGIKWDDRCKRPDGTWDLEMVENTAHYITPCGARLDEADRLPLLAEGEWIPTVRTLPWRRGYRVTRMMTPFPTGNFGNMARAFVEAKRKQDAGQFNEDGRSPLRVFVYERLAEKFYMEKRVPELTEIDARVTEYERGQRVSETPAYSPIYVGRKRIMLLTVDVQKDHEWWVLREWIEGGDSGLFDCGQSDGIQSLREIGVKHHVKGVLIDNSYEERAKEFIESSSTGLLKGAVLCYGRDKIRDKNGNPQEYIVYMNKDPYEGTANQGKYRINTVTHHPDRLKNQLYTLTLGTSLHGWHLPKGLPDYYAPHMTAEQSIDGHWERVRKANHTWDCEVLQLLGAKLFGMWRDTPVMELNSSADSQPDTPPPAPVVSAATPQAPQQQMFCVFCKSHKPLVIVGKMLYQCQDCRGKQTVNQVTRR